jgi:hypothetical protein
MNSTKDLLLILASICFIIIVGAATYEHLAVIPQWSAAPPSSFSLFNGKYPLRAQYFWIPVHPVTVLLMAGALITNWKNSRKKNILTVFIGYLAILVITYVYFVPQLMTFMETPYQDTVDEALLAKASMWETLSLIRLVVLFVLSYILLSALTKPNEIIVVQQATAVPLSYENDSLGG